MSTAPNPPRAIAISGSPRSPSRSKALAQVMLSALEVRGWRTRLIDLAELPADALLVRTKAPEVEEAMAAVGDASVVIAATPTYRALYTGLLKAFFDLMPQDHLDGKLCVSLQTGVAREHALSIEYGLRPLFASLGGVPAAGMYATDDEFLDGSPSDDLAARVESVVRAVIELT